MSIDTDTELSAPDDTVDRRTARARQRRRSFLALGIIAALVLPFLLVGGWFVWELSPPGHSGAPVQVDLTQGGSASAEAPTLRPPAG